MTTQQKSIYEKFPFFIKMRPSTNLIGRNKEVDDLCEILYKKRMKNAVIVGPAGSGKTEIVRAVAEATKDKYEFIEFSMASLAAGAKYKGEFEEKIINALDYVVRYNEVRNQKYILFIDEIHTIMTTGSTSDDRDQLTAANILKPYLSNQQIILWGATTEKEFKRTLLCDSALARRITPYYINQLDKQSTIKVLDEFCEHKHSIESLEFLYEISNTIGGNQPDISIELADRVMAKEKRTNSKISRKDIKEIASRMQENYINSGLTKGN